MTRREAREELFNLLFESEFRSDESDAEIFATSEENREVADDEYIRRAYFAISEKKEEIDELIGKLGSACADRSRKIFDFRGICHLTAECSSFEKENIFIGAKRVNSGGKPRRARSDYNYIMHSCSSYRILHCDQ